jgi:uncharacterized repeat protein (TIGR01451 family)
VVTDEVPAGLTYLNSNPAANNAPTGDEWQLGDLQPNETRTIEVNFRVDRAGSFNYCAGFTGGGGLAGRDCVSTVATAGQLKVSILGPPTAEIGGQVTYTIDIANQSDATLTHVVVSDRFDPGLEHAVATGGAIERDLQDEIPPRQSRQLAVTFQVVQSGQLCQDVTITADGGLRGEAHTCLTVPNRQAPAAAPPVAPPASPPANPPATTPPQLPPATVPPSTPNPPVTPQAAGKLTVQATGPDRRKLGEVAQFVITLTNQGSEALTNVVVADNLETSLDVFEASPGSKPRSGALIWTLDSLAPGATKTLKLNCHCVKEATKACNRVTVTADGDVTAGDEACLEIYATDATLAPTPAAAAAANLTVAIAEQSDPIRVGGDTSYQIVVKNAGSTPQQQVVVSVKISEELRLINITTSPVGATASFPRQVRFKPVAEIRPGESITFDLQIQADSAGTGTVQTEVTAPGLAQPVTATASTQILD